MCLIPRRFRDDSFYHSRRHRHERNGFFEAEGEHTFEKMTYYRLFPPQLLVDWWSFVPVLLFSLLGSVQLDHSLGQVSLSSGLLRPALTVLGFASALCFSGVCQGLGHKRALEKMLNQALKEEFTQKWRFSYHIFTVGAGDNQIKHQKGGSIKIVQHSPSLQKA